jgi:hypothetical protein
MHVSLTRVTTGEQPVANATIVAEELARWLRDIEGFEGIVMLSREGESLGLTFWKNREVAEAHLSARMEFIDRMTSVAGVKVEEITPYRVMFAELGPLREGGD